MRLTPPRPPTLTLPFTHSPYPLSALDRAREPRRPQRPRGLIGCRSTAPYARERARKAVGFRRRREKAIGVLRRSQKWGRGRASLSFSCVLLSIPTVSKPKSSGGNSSYACVLEDLRSKPLPPRIRRTPSREYGTVQTGFQHNQSRGAAPLSSGFSPFIHWPSFGDQIGLPSPTFFLWQKLYLKQS